MTVRPSAGAPVREDTARKRPKVVSDQGVVAAAKLLIQAKGDPDTFRMAEAMLRSVLVERWQASLLGHVDRVNVPPAVPPGRTGGMLRDQRAT